MLDIYEIYGIIEPLKRGETEGLMELLKSDKNISRKVRDAIIALLVKNPPKKPKGRQKEEDIPMWKLFELCKLFEKIRENEKMPVDDTLEKMVPLTAMSSGTIKGHIYSRYGKLFRKAITKKG